MSPLSRRRFVQSTALATALAPLRAWPESNRPIQDSVQNPEPFLVDVNAYVSRWPFRRLQADDPADLVSQLRRSGVKRAWVGNLEALLSKDTAGVNARLAETCQREGDLLVPFGSVNPSLPDWEEDLRRCNEVHHMPGIRLHPNYHGYTLEDGRFRRLAHAAHERGLLLQIAAEMEDSRTQHPLLQVPPVELSPLGELAKNLPELPIVILNSSVSTPLATRLAGAGQVYFDTARQEGLAGINRALTSIPLERLLFGSFAPLFYYQANLYKLRESVLTEAQLSAIAFGNADRLTGRAGAST